ncbi:restriction endonuclease subunit S [Alphaproteobacteria bacterium]|nr:restriction endonuclease subunit S [Alphaproteobacteria bacterium]
MNSLDGYQGVDSYWYDQVPSYWKKTKNKYVFCQDKHVVGEDWEKFTLLTMGKSGVKPRDMDGGGKFPASFETYQTVEPNQLIFCLFDLDETPRTIGMSKDYGMITSAYDVFSTTEGNDPQFWTYFYQMIDDHKGLRPFYTGLRKVVRSETFMGIEVFSPPLEEQKLISRYLDKKTEQIDRLVEKIQKKIELLKEQRTSLINHFVTKGLDPNVEMKDSGVEWIGEIPKHYTLQKIKYLFREKKSKSNPELNSGSISFGQVVYKDDESILESTKESYQEVLEGEFLINPLNLNYDLKSLRIGKSKINVVVSQGYIVLQILEGQDSDYFEYLLRKFDVVHMKSLGQGVRQTISFNNLKNEELVIPPIEEQKEIFYELNLRTNQIDRLCTVEEKRISVLREYRQSLISSVVTGKVRVTDDMI